MEKASRTTFERWSLEMAYLSANERRRPREVVLRIREKLILAIIILGMKTIICYREKRMA